MHGPTMDMQAFTAPPRIRVLQMVGNGIVGGMESVVLRLLERLPRDRFEVFAMCPYEGPFTARLRALGVDCMAVPMPDDPPWSVVQSVVAFVRSARIDVLHAHLTNAHVLAALAGSITGRPVLTTLHGRHLNMADLEAHRALGTHLCTVCRHSELHALSAGAKPRRVSCVPNGVDTTVFTPAAAQAGGGASGLAAAAANDGRLADAQPAAAGPVIGFVGRLSPEKGPDVFVRAALLLLRSRLPDARFVLIGDGPMRDTVLKLLARPPARAADLAARAAQRSAPDGGKSVANGVPSSAGNSAANNAANSAPGVYWQGLRDDMPAAYRELDMLVSTSHSEAMPLAIMEAMASGLPVVATRVGGVPDLVEHGSTGWLAQPGNVDNIADCIERLARDPQQARRMGAQGRARMVAGFDLATSVSATARLLERLASAEAGQRSRRARRDKHGVPDAAAALSVAAAGALSNSVLSGGTLVNGALVNGALVNGALANGLLANGALANGVLANGVLANGVLANGVLANGVLANGVPANGSSSNTAPSNGALSSGVLANGVLSNGAPSNGAAKPVVAPITARAHGVSNGSAAPR